MKIIVILNKNVENLKLLLKSLSDNLLGEFETIIIDQNNLINENIENLKIIKTSNIKNEIIEILNSNLAQNFMIIDENKYCYDKVELNSINECLKNNDDVFCFSLSLGENITFCSNMNCDNVFLPEKKEKDIVFWNWSLHYMDFGYPLNLDGTVFRGKELYKLIKIISFNDSIELENSLQIFDNYPKETMCCFSNNKIIEVIFENKNEIVNFNHVDLKKDRTKYIINSKIQNEYIDKVSDQI